MKKIFYGWWVVGGAFLLLFCADGTYFYAFPVFFEAMLKDMEWSRAETAAALSIGIFVLGAISPLIGILVSKIGIRLITILGSVVAGIGFILLSTVTEPWQFYLYYGLILSLGIACIDLVPNMAAVGSWFVKRRSMALGIATAGIGAGGAVLPPLANWLISMYGWQTSFLFLAALTTLIGVPISAIIMRTREEKKSISGEKQEKDVSSDRVLIERTTIEQAVKGQAFWLISIGGMLWVWAYMTGLIHLVAFAVDVGIERVAAAGAVGLLAVFSIPGRLGFGRLGDAVDKRYVFMMGTFLQIVAFIVLMRSTNLTMLYIYSLLLGINIGGVTPILPGLLIDHFGKKYFGIIYGVSSFMLCLGGAIGPIYGGWIFDITGSYSAAFLTSIIVSIIAMIAVYLSGAPPKTLKQTARLISN